MFIPAIRAVEALLTAGLLMVLPPALVLIVLVRVDRWAAQLLDEQEGRVQ